MSGSAGAESRRGGAGAIDGTAGANGTNGTNGTNGAAGATGATGPAGPANDGIEYYKAIALADLGLTADQMIWDYFCPAVRGRDSANLNTTGLGSSQVGALQKIWRLTTGGLGTAWANPLGGGNNDMRYIIAGTGDKWAILARFAITGLGIGANSMSGVAVHDTHPFTAPNMVIGGRGASSTSNFVCYGNSGTFIDSGLALDSASHWHLVTRSGSTTKYYLDKRAAVSGNAAPSADSYLFIGVSETTSRAINCDAAFLACGFLVPA